MTRRHGPHLELEELLSLAQRAAPEGDQRAHLEACAACRTEYAEVEEMVDDMREDDTSLPPAELARRAVALFGRERPRAPGILETLGRLVLGPTGGLQPAFAVRGEGVVSRLRFAGEVADVELEVADGRYGLRVTGQVLPRPGAGMPVVVWAEASGQVLREAPVGEHGLFVLPDVSESNFNLVFDLGERRLRLPIELGEGT